MKLCKLIIALTLVLATLANTAFAAEWYATITSKTTVYKSADKSSDTLGTLSSGKSVSLIATKNGWAKIELNGKTGYISASNVKKTAKTGYVTVGTVGIYKSNSLSSTKLATACYGATVKVSAVEGDWARLSFGSVEGFCKKSALSTTNPNTMSRKVYPQKKSITVYTQPNTSSSSSSVSYKTTLTCTAIYNETWCRVTLNGKVGFAKKSDLGTSKYDGYSTSSPASAKSVSMDWFKSNIQSIFYKGCVATVTDVATGISWKVKRTGGYNHADVEPLTSADTAAMKQACGSDYDTWNRRAIWVTIGDKKYAASMNCKPHGDDRLSGNSFSGHHCIHFTNSKTHGTNKVDSDHQAAIKRALAKG